MNNNYSNGELNYKKRLLLNNVLPAVKSFPVIVITGARHVGKSTSGASSSMPETALNGFTLKL